jgi:hypothetical protein
MSATCQQGLLTLQRKRTGGNQQVTVKHIHQQVNVSAFAEDGGPSLAERISKGSGNKAYSSSGSISMYCPLPTS